MNITTTITGLRFAIDFEKDSKVKHYNGVASASKDGWYYIRMYSSEDEDPVISKGETLKELRDNVVEVIKEKNS